MDKVNKFDVNRPNYQEMAAPNNAELMEVIQKQEAAIIIMQQQLSLLQAQPQQVQQAESQQLNPKEIVQQFRHIRCLDKDHNVTAFIRSVDAVMAICPAMNQPLLNLVLSIIKNEKISGDAANYIRELGGNPSWEQMKSKLLEQYRPKMTYGDIFNKCRGVKVSNLRDLFNYFTKAKFELNEIFEFDEEKPVTYEPNRVDRDLVNIVSEKIDITVKSYFNKNSSLNQIITTYSQMNALDDPRAIHFKSRKNNNFSKNQYSQNASKNNDNQQEKTGQNTKQNSNYQNNNQNKNQNFKYQFYSNKHGNRENNSGQTRNSHMSVETQNSRPSYMEIDTVQEIQDEQYEEVNFLTLPQSLLYP